MKNILLRLCGYRKYHFTLFNGREVTFWTKTRGIAIQKALNLERQIRRNLNLTAATMKSLGRLGFKSSQTLPDQLVRNVLGKQYSTPDRPASIAG